MRRYSPSATCTSVSKTQAIAYMPLAINISWGIKWTNTSCSLRGVLFLKGTFAPHIGYLLLGNFRKLFLIAREAWSDGWDSQSVPQMCSNSSKGGSQPEQWDTSRQVIRSGGAQGHPLCKQQCAFLTISEKNWETCSAWFEEHQAATSSQMGSFPYSHGVTMTITGGFAGPQTAT